MDRKNIIHRDLTKLRKMNPLVHNITNFVAMNTSANVLLALGASPIMSHCEEELKEIINISNALVINIGTLDLKKLSSMKIAQEIALDLNKPIIFDPVGAGASSLRTNAALEIIKRGVSVIKGNASEIKSICTSSHNTKGVDSSEDSEDVLEVASKLSHDYQCTVAISGKTDFIVSQDNISKVENGSEIFTKVTAMGCSLASTIGSFVAINDNIHEATVSATAIYSLAGEIAAPKSYGPASFYNNFLDELYNINFESLDKLRVI